MAISDLPIFSYYNVQRFTQFGSMDCANWYGVQVEDSKKGQALYPSMGRKHVTFFGENKLIFNIEPSFCFKTINFAYYIVSTNVIVVDQFFNQTIIGSVKLGATVWFDFFTVNTITYAMMTDGTNIYIITEASSQPITMQTVTDNQAPKNPTYVKAFGNRFVVSAGNTPNFFMTDINLANALNPGPGLNLNIIFSILNGNTTALFDTASSIIRQMAVLHNQLYLFFDYTTDVYANIPNQVTINGVTAELPFKKNTSYNFDFGIQDPNTLDVNFGMMAWLAKNSAGLVQFMVSNGQQPTDISTQAINVLIENSRHPTGESPFLSGEVDAFLYQYENTMFYRVSAGKFNNEGIIDLNDTDNCIEYNFSTKKWTRSIELNGERNRIKKHIYFNNMHLVTVQGDPAVYEMAGNIYYNETRNPAQLNPQALDAFNKYPMRYELVTRQIFAPDYSEFITDYVEIDMVFGYGFYENSTAFGNTVFIITEDADTSGNPVYVITEDADPQSQPVFVITEDGNTPTFDDNFYNALFKPSIGLFYSDDGGITFFPADIRKFSPLGNYQWRMRWYQLGASRNRCYKLICISSVPVVILGAVHDTRRSSGGAN